MKLKSLIMAGLVALGSLGGVLALNYEANAAVTCPAGSLHENQSKPSYADCNLPDQAAGDDLGSRAVKIINVILAALGFVAVAVIIIGGISFITSQGDSAKVAKGRNTILYGIIGLVVALLAFAIVNFVLKGIFG